MKSFLVGILRSFRRPFLGRSKCFFRNPCTTSAESPVLEEAYLWNRGVCHDAYLANDLMYRVVLRVYFFRENNKLTFGSMYTPAPWQSSSRAESVSNSNHLNSCMPRGLVNLSMKKIKIRIALFVQYAQWYVCMHVCVLRNHVMSKGCSRYTILTSHETI